MFTRIEGPETLRYPDRTLVLTPALYLGWQAWHVRDRGLARVEEAGAAKAARINHGRWIVDCDCGDGALTRPDWRLACCAACGRVYRRVDFPEAQEAIARILLLRPRREDQNWSGEPAEALADENEAHGLARGI